MSNDVIEREVTINAPVDRVWSLITEAEHLGTWFGERGADIDLRPGGELEIRWDGHDITGVVEAVEPTSRFAFRWRRSGIPVDAELGGGNSTLVEFFLASEGESTQVRVIESGFESLEISDDERKELYESHTKGWPHELGELVTYAVGVVA